jgi:hypothetical protein
MQRGHRCIGSFSVSSALLAGSLLTAVSSNTFGAIIYNESTDGDLSGSGLSPTSLTVSEGENIVLGSYGKIDNVVDRDYFTFTVPAGLDLVAISVLADHTSDPGTAFIGVESGNEVTLPTNAPNATGLLGWLHFTATSGNIISDMGVPDLGSTGFTPPLGAGSYAFWVQENSSGSVTYGLDFQLLPASLPDSGPGMFGFAGAFGLLAIGRKFAPARR